MTAKDKTMVGCQVTREIAERIQLTAYALGMSAATLIRTGIMAELPKAERRVRAIRKDIDALRK
jgi:hypothetical protein